MQIRSLSRDPGGAVAVLMVRSAPLLYGRGPEGLCGRRADEPYGRGPVESLCGVLLAHVEEAEAGDFCFLEQSSIE